MTSLLFTVCCCLTPPRTGFTTGIRTATAATRDTAVKLYLGKEKSMQWHWLLVVALLLCGSVYLVSCSNPLPVDSSSRRQTIQQNWLAKPTIETPLIMQWGHRLELLLEQDGTVYSFLVKPFGIENGRMTFVVSELDVADPEVRLTEYNTTALLNEPLSVPCGQGMCELMIVTAIDSENHLHVQPVPGISVTRHHLR
jgi:hypothetical protein